MELPAAHQRDYQGAYQRFELKRAELERAYSHQQMLLDNVKVHNKYPPGWMDNLNLRERWERERERKFADAKDELGRFDAHFEHQIKKAKEAGKGNDMAQQKQLELLSQSSILGQRLRGSSSESLASLGRKRPSKPTPSEHSSEHTESLRRVLERYEQQKEGKQQGKAKVQQETEMEKPVEGDAEKPTQKRKKAARDIIHPTGRGSDEHKEHRPTLQMQPATSTSEQPPLPRSEKPKQEAVELTEEQRRKQQRHIVDDMLFINRHMETQARTRRLRAHGPFYDNPPLGPKDRPQPEEVPTKSQSTKSLTTKSWSAGPPKDEPERPGNGDTHAESGRSPPEKTESKAEQQNTESGHFDVPSTTTES